MDADPPIDPTRVDPPKAISPLRARMIDDMTLRRFGEKTQSIRRKATVPSMKWCFKAPAMYSPMASISLPILLCNLLPSSPSEWLGAMNGPNWNNPNTLTG